MNQLRDSPVDAAAILILIGQIGAGKTEIGRRIAAKMSAQLMSIDDLRRSGLDTNAADVVRTLKEFPKDTRLVFECTGAAPDFEDFLSQLERIGRRSFVVMLCCPIEVAMHRIRTRVEWLPPRGGGSWVPELRWTETQLRLVPADLCISTDACEPESAATLIAERWVSEIGSRWSYQTRPTGQYSYSQLATYNACPLAYRFKYVEARPELAETPAMFLGKRLHETLFHLHHTSMERLVSEGEIVSELKARIINTMPRSSISEAENIVARGAHILRSYYSKVFRSEVSQTVALEKRFKLQLDTELFFVGVIDRVAITPAGLYEVIDYKTVTHSEFARPCSPDLLQMATYGAATMLEYRVPVLKTCQQLLLTNQRNEFLLRRADLRRVRLALRRWITRCWEDQEKRGNPGRWCATCQFNSICSLAAVPPITSAMQLA